MNFIWACEAGGGGGGHVSLKKVFGNTGPLMFAVIKTKGNIVH